MDLDTVLVYTFLFIISLLLLIFLVVLLKFSRRIQPIIESITSSSGGLELPKISIKNAIGYGLYLLFTKIDFEALTKKYLGGNK